jgi:hypothetical protein
MSAKGTSVMRVLRYSLEANHEDIFNHYDHWDGLD